DTVHIFGVVVSSTALAGILQSVRWVWEPFLARKIGSKSDEIGSRIPLFLVALTCATVGYVLIPWKLSIGIWVLIVLFVMMSRTATQTLMDGLASDVAKVMSVITVMTAYSVATDVGSALGPMLSYVLIELENGLVWVYLGGATIYFLIMVVYRLSGRHKGFNKTS